MAKRILVTGIIGGWPITGAGNTWSLLPFLLGLRKLGFEVFFAESMAANRCVDEQWKSAPFRSSANVRYFSSVMDRFGFSDHAALLAEETEDYWGLSHSEVEKLAPTVDLLINYGGRMLRSVLASVRRRMFYDGGPGLTQVYQAGYGADMGLAGHDVYVTVGLNLGEPDCPFPTCGIHWKKTLPPAVLSEWATDEAPGTSYTTVGIWKSEHVMEWNGVKYGDKADEFPRVMDLPRRVNVPLELCMDIWEERDRVRLEEAGWRLASPGKHAATPDAYRDYVLRSRGEFTCVKSSQCKGRTGWFSDRSACYLAAGRPVIIQDTGIGRHLPTGQGLLTFTDLESAAAAIQEVEADYPRHAAAAAAFAREHLDSDRVLGRLLELAGL